MEQPEFNSIMAWLGDKPENWNQPEDIVDQIAVVSADEDEQVEVVMSILLRWEHNPGPTTPVQVAAVLNALKRSSEGVFSQLWKLVLTDKPDLAAKLLPPMSQVPQAIDPVGLVIGEPELFALLAPVLGRKDVDPMFVTAMLFYAANKHDPYYPAELMALMPPETVAGYLGSMLEQDPKIPANLAGALANINPQWTEKMLQSLDPEHIQVLLSNAAPHYAENFVTLFTVMAPKSVAAIFTATLSAPIRNLASLMVSKAPAQVADVLQSMPAQSAQELLWAMWWGGGDADAYYINLAKLIESLPPENMRALTEPWSKQGTEDSLSYLMSLMLPKSAAVLLTLFGVEARAEALDQLLTNVAALKTILPLLPPEAVDEALPLLPRGCGANQPDPGRVVSLALFATLLRPVTGRLYLSTVTKSQGTARCITHYGESVLHKPCQPVTVFDDNLKALVGHVCLASASTRTCCRKSDAGLPHWSTSLRALTHTYDRW